MKKKTLKTETYVLQNGESPLSYMLASHHNKRNTLLYWDEEKQINRELCYARNQKSIFADEQDGNKILEPIVFEDGMLIVPKDNPMLQQFLEFHPSYNKLFRKVNTEKDAAQEVEVLNAQVEALVEARAMEIGQLETVSRVLFNVDVSKISTAELKRDVLVYAKNEPENFLNIINDPMLKLMAEVQSFFDDGKLMMKKQNVHFNTKTNKKRMMTVPFGEDRNEMIAHYLKSDEGIETLKFLQKIK
tara:strand:- start:1396 stop:2130 length:735 start_codon:yes stop_codon:yes gene_type:complete